MTITRGQTVNGTNADPSVVTFGAVTAGQLCIVAATERSGNSHTTFSISDNGANTGWTKEVAEDTEIGDLNARRTFIIWWRVLTASDASASPFTVTVNGPTTANSTGDVFNDSLGGDWELAEKSTADTGTGSSSPLSTGSTPSVGDGELLTYSCAIWRTGTLETSQVSWSSNGGTKSDNFPGTSNQRCLSRVFGYTTSGGAKSNAVTFGGASNEGNAAILVFEAAAAAGETITAEQGTYSLSGNAATLRADHRVTAEQGSYALSGNAASLLANQLLGAEQGSYALSGLASSLRADHRLTAAQGTYVLSGLDAALIAATGATITAEMGSYVISGQAAALLADHLLAAAQGVYTLSGQSASLRDDHRLVAGQGSYALSGQAADLLRNHLIEADLGVYAISGSDADFVRHVPLSADLGVYVISGDDAGLLWGQLLAAEQGAYAISGLDATLIESGGLVAEQGVYVMSGLDAALVSSAQLDGRVLDEGMLVNMTRMMRT